MNKTDAALQTIPGTLPALGEPLEGCVYSARCPMAKPVCKRREPDLYAWPGDAGAKGRAEAEAMPADPAAYSPNHAKPVGVSDRHARCYFAEVVEEMPHTTPVLATSLEERGGASDVLVIDDMVRTFKDGRKQLTAVADVSLSLRKGETFGLVGESGSGKTTLAKCVTGLIPADSGTITFEGGVLKSTAGKRSQDALRAIQMVFQNPDSTLNPAWSTRAILTRAVRKLGGAKAGSVRAKVDKLSADVRVEPRFLFQKPTELSGGQKQRVAIARAFAGDPTLVVCDEPASALDVSVQASILNLLVELQTNEQTSYVFISHDLAVVRYISDRIGVMYLAELIEVGAAADVFDPPHHPYTEALLSSIPRLDFEKQRERIPLKGSMPSLSDPPTGCRFHTRCHRFLGDICVEQIPPDMDAGDGHFYKCHIPPEELRSLQKADAPAPEPAAAD
jgi:peptide/nickel transport system ATP-binding protein